MRGHVISDEQARQIWIDGYRAGRSARYARRLGIYEECPWRDARKPEAPPTVHAPVAGKSAPGLC